MTMTTSERWLALTERLDGVGEWLAPLGLRAILAWEFWQAGFNKYRGSNWFSDIQADFPFPFNHVPPDLSWQVATWFERVGALALLFGLATRFFAFSLLVLTMVATASVHWPMEWMSLRDLAMGLRGSTESPHHRYTSFRVRGRIYATAPREGGYLHVFVDEEDRERMILIDPDAYQPLGWGKKTVGLRVKLERAQRKDVGQLLRAAWRRKLPQPA